MNSVAQMKLDDEQVLMFIKNLGQKQMYKCPNAFEQFCVDCGIFYTNSIFVLNKFSTDSPEDYDVWREGFVEKCKHFNILFKKENK